MFEQKSCLYEGQVAFVLEGFLHYEFPADLPPLTAELRLERTKFSTEWMTYTLGYDEDAPPPECDSQDSAPARADQSWLSESCICVTDAPPDAPPARDDDCRVTDPDGDGEPGATLELVVSGAQIWTYEVLQRVRLRYVNGYRAPNGNVYADLETGATTQVLECNEVDLMSGCLLRDPAPCAPKYNQTELVPVDDDYDCARVVAEKNGLFPRPIPPFPAGCVAGT